MGFDSLDGGESPARTALALILDFIDPSLLPVVNGFWIVVGRSDFDPSAAGDWLLEAEHGFIFGLGKSGELVVTKLERVGATVEIADVTVASEPKAEAEVVLFTDESEGVFPHP